MENFTDRARKVLQLAKQEAHRLGQPYVGTDHLLVGIIKDGGGVAAAVLKDAGVNLASVTDYMPREEESAVESGTDDGKVAVPLRDWFAGQALAAHRSLFSPDFRRPGDAAKRAYELADAMLEARKT